MQFMHKAYSNNMQYMKFMHISTVKLPSNLNSLIYGQYKYRFDDHFYETWR